MTTKIRAWVDSFTPDGQAETDDGSNGLLVMEGYDDCILGVCHRFNSSFVVYDMQKVIEKLKADGLTDDDAREFFEFNQLGAWVGDATPGFVELPPRD